MEPPGLTEQPPTKSDFVGSPVSHTKSIHFSEAKEVPEFRYVPTVRRLFKQDGANEPECKHVQKATYVQMTLL